MKKLIITEKPSVARDIARVLKITKRYDGYMEGTDYVITWAVGHLVTLCEPEDYDENLKKWNFNRLPIIPSAMELKPYPKTKQQLEIITKLCNRKDIDALICATDSGREGELIFRYIYIYTKCKKPFERLWISSMTDEAIQKGFNTLKPGEEYNRLYLSAKCRSEADWLVGINATRAYTTMNNTLLSIGRVQTPTLALVVNRYQEMQNFIPKDYYEVKVEYEDFFGQWFLEQISETKIMKEEKAKQIAEKVKGKEGIVTEVEKKRNTQKPPFLYDLTELQRDGNKLYGFTANQVLDIAQNLYEKRKLITYPRTDSRFLSTDMKKTVEDTLRAINVMPYAKAIATLYKDGKLTLKFSKRIIDDKKVTDHHAIIPTKKNPSNINLSEDKKKIYQLIVKRFIAVFYPDFVFQTTKVIVTCEKETFVSKGKIVKDLGWKKLYQNHNKEDEILPPVKKGDTLYVHDTKIEKKKTTPPKPYTEATLLSAMENAGRFVEEEELKEQLKEAGFGTPATRASIIERLIQVQYIYRKGKSLYPTEKGTNLIRIVPKQLKSPDMTGKWERGLTKISQDKLTVEPFMESIHKFVGFIVRSANKSKGFVAFEPASSTNEGTYTVKGKIFGTCPLCKEGSITQNSKSYYCSRFVNGCKFTAWKNSIHEEVPLSEEMMIVLLKTKEIQEVRIGESKYKIKMEDNGKIQKVKI